MNFELTSQQRQLQDEIIAFAKGELNHHSDEEAVVSKAIWRACGEMCLLGLPVPEQFGGAGLDPLSCALAMEALGYGCSDSGLVFSIGAHIFSAVVPLWKFGSVEQKRRYLEKLCSGELMGVHAMTEPQAGSNPWEMQSTAEKSSQGYVLNGRKTFITNVPLADIILFFAATDRHKGFHGGISAFILESGMSGLSFSSPITKMGLKSSPFGDVICDNVQLDDLQLLGRLGQGGTIFSHSMDWERVCIFAANVGSMQRILETSIKYARTRRQFGSPIGKFQAVSHAIADMKVSLEAARLLVYKAAWNLDRRHDVSLDAAIAKLFTSEHLLKAALKSLHIHGAYGYCEEFGVARELRDAVGSTIYSGTSEMQRTIIAKWLGL